MENVFAQNCPICAEDLFTSVKKVVFLPCGHPMHGTCQKDMLEDTMKVGGPLVIAKCPLCQRAILKKQLEMYSTVIENAIAEHPLPKALEKKVSIICNECLIKSVVPFHFYGMKCPSCNFYNTAQVGGDIPVEEVVDEPEDPPTLEIPEPPHE